MVFATGAALSCSCWPHQSEIAITLLKSARAFFFTQNPPFVAKNIPNFYPDSTSERWTLMVLQRLDNVLIWQSGFRCPCPGPRDLTNAIGLGHRSRGCILKGSLGLPTMPMENYPETEAGLDPCGHLWVTSGVYLWAGQPPWADIILSHPPDLT